MTQQSVQETAVRLADEKAELRRENEGLRAEAECCPLCWHAWSRHDPEDGCCDAPAREGLAACPCGLNGEWMRGRIAKKSREALAAKTGKERRDA